MPEGSISSKVIGGFTKASASNTKAHDGDHNRLKLEQRAQTFLRSMHTVPDQAPSIPKSYRDFPDSEVEDASLNRTSFRISEMDTEMSSVDDIGSESGAHSEDESFALDEEEEPMPRYIIHPQSTNKVVWDVFVSVLIFYSVTNIPFRIGFGVDSEGFAYGFDWFVDGMFGFDIILSFFTAYWHNDELETSRRRIVVHYLRGWFLIDLASTLPFDHIVAALMHNDNASDVNSSLRSIKLIKFFRLVRLIKLVRLLKLKKFGSSLEGAFSLNPALQRLLKLLLQIIFICHLLACFWYFTSTLDDSSDDNWVMAHGLSSDSIPTQYLASFYWTVATMMAVGYGDIHAVNDMERMYSIFVQVVGATCFGFIIANISAFLETFDPRASAYRSRMDRLKQYMCDRDLPRKLQRRVRKYYDYVLSKESIFDDANILAQLPSHLTETVILHIHGHKARTINFLKYEDSSFVAYIMARSKVLLALSGEVICEQDSVGTDIYMVLKGKVEAIVLEIDETEHKRFRINQDEEENALMRKGAERINSASGTLRINAPALASDADAGREAPPMLTGSTGNSSSRLEPPRPRDVRNMVKQQLGASSRNVVKKGIAFGKKVKHAVVTGLYNRGSNFGEVGVLRNKPHEVTFRANQTCDLLSISKEHMEYAIYMYPTSALRFRKRCDKHAELLEKSIASSTEYFPHSDRHVKTLVTVDARMHQSAATVERRIGRMVLSNMIAYDITGRFQSQAQRGRKVKKNRARTLGLRTSSAPSESHPDKSHHVAVKTSIKVRRALVNQKSRAGSLLFKTPEVTEELAILGTGASSTSRVFPMSDVTSRTESLSVLDSAVPFDAPSTTTILPTSRSVTRSKSRSRYIVDAKPDSGPLSLLPSLLNPALEKKTQGARSHIAWGFRTARSAASEASSSTAMSTARHLLPHQLRRKAKNSGDGLEIPKKRPGAISTDRYDDNAATKKSELFSPGASSESGSGGDDDSSRADHTNSSEAHDGQPVSTAGVHKLSDMPARSNTGLMVSRVAGKICEDVEMDLDSVLRELWIVPPGHGLKVKWDLLIAFFIVYSVLLVPFRIGFAQSSEGFSKAFDILVDIFFGLDMIVAFRTGFESSDQDVVIVVPLAIAKQYLKGWFLVDFMSTFPFDAVLAALLASADEEALRSFKLIKIFRMIRLLKLIRLFKLRKILGELDSEIELSSGFTKLVTLFLQITFVAHLFACFWFFAASSEDDIRERWYVRLGFSPDDDQDVSSKYISSLYWSFTTMTTVGYGDISPTSDPERIYAIFIMIMGATIFGYVVGSIANLISQLDIADALYKAKMNELDEYLSEQGIPRDLRRECKSCYAYSLSLKSVFDERALLSALSPSLRQEIIITIHQAAVDAIPLFRDQTATFTADLIQVMHPQLALPGTFIVRHNSIGGMIYFIVNGEVLVYEDTWPQPDEQGRVDFERAKLFRHRNGNFFGHQAVLSGKRHEITAKCTKLTQLYILSKSAIGELVDSVPPFALLLQSALRSAIRRQDMAFGKLQRGRAGNKTSKLWSLVQNHFNDILNMSPNKFKRMSVEANSCTKLEELIGRIVGVNLDTRVGEPGGADSFTATVRKIREAKRNGGFDVSSSSSIADLPSAEVSAEMQALPVTGAWKFKASQVEKKVDKRASDGSVSDTSLWEASEPGVVTPAESTSVLFDTAADPDNDASDARPMHDE